MDLRLILQRQNQLQQRLDMLAEQSNLLLDQVTELNLRVRFTMQSTLVQKKNTGIVAPGKPEVEITNLYHVYVEGGRDRFLAAIQREMEALDQQIAQENAHAESAASGPDPAVTQDPTDATADAPSPFTRH